MEQTVTLLQHISQTAYKTHETVKTIASYPEATDFPYITKLNMTLGEIQAISISLTFKIITKSSDAELRESIHIMYKSMESGMEMYSVLKNSFPCKVPGNLKEWLDKNMESLTALLMELAAKIQGKFNIPPAFLGHSSLIGKDI